MPKRTQPGSNISRKHNRLGVNNPSQKVNKVTLSRQQQSYKVEALRRLVDVGDFKTAAIGFNELARLIEEDPKLWILAAENYTKIGNHKSASHCYNQAAKLRKQDLELWKLAGDNYAKINDFNAAAYVYDQAAILDDNPELWKLAGDSYAKTNNYKNAAFAYNKAATSTNNSKLWKLAGDNYAKIDEFKLGAFTYSKAADVTDDPRLWKLAGDNYAKIDEFKLAAFVYKQAAKLTRDYNYWRLAGDNYAKIDEFTLAALMYMQAARLSQDFELWQLAGDYYFKIGNFDRADIAYTNVLRSKDDDLLRKIGNGYMSVAYTYQERGNILDSKKAYYQAGEFYAGAAQISNAPKDWEIASYCYHHAGDERAVVLVDSNILDSIKSEGTRYLEAGDFDQACDIYANALKFDNYDLLKEIASSYMKAGYKHMYLSNTAVSEKAYYQAGEFYAEAALMSNDPEDWKMAQRCYHHAGNEFSAMLAYSNVSYLTQSKYQITTPPILMVDLPSTSTNEMDFKHY